MLHISKSLPLLQKNNSKYKWGKEEVAFIEIHNVKCFTYVTLFNFHNHHEESIIISQFPDFEKNKKPKT